MRILFVSHGGNREGAPMALLNIIKEMLNRGIEVGVVVPAQKGFFYEEVCKTATKVFYRGEYPSLMLMPNNTGNLWEMFKVYCYKSKITLAVHWMIYKIIKEFNPDIVHTNTSAIDYALLGCKLTHTPHVWHVRELLKDGCNINVFPSERIFKLKLKLPFSHNIAITNAVFDHYSMTKKDTVIYDGVIDENKKASLYELPAFPYFLAVGYISDVKGTKEILEQFAIFSRSNKDAHMVYAGSFGENDSYYKSCMAIAEDNNICDRIHFLGNRNDIYSLMSGAEALVIGSKFEGFGFAMAEAMYNHCLVIGKNVGGTKEQFDKGCEEAKCEIGLRFDDYSQLPNLMHYALSNDFSHIKNLAYNVVVNNYTVQRNVDGILRLYESVLQEI